MAAAVGLMKNAEAKACCKLGRGLKYFNGCPIELVEPAIAHQKANETITRIGSHHFDCIDLEVVVKGGDVPSQTYAIRQAIAKALIAFYHEYGYGESKIKELKDKIARLDRSLLVADPNELSG